MAGNIVAGLMFMREQYGDNNITISAEHEVLYVGGGDEGKDVPSEEKDKMTELGWLWNDEFECWKCFT